MKTLAIAGGITGLLAAAFMVGLFSGSTPLMLAGFCAWTPGVLFLGYAIGRVNIQISVGTKQTSPNGRAAYTPQQLEAIKRRIKTQEEF